MLGVSDRQIENAAQAGEAHSVVAFELDSPRCEYIVREASYAFNTIRQSCQ